jgi:hypothetical protein
MTHGKGVSESVFCAFCFLISLLATASLLHAQTRSTADCISLAPAGDAPYTAEDYVYPLSLRANLVLMIKSEMRANGEFFESIDMTFRDPFHQAIARRQEALGEEPTGCVTWSVVRFYDPLSRETPN